MVSLKIHCFLLILCVGASYCQYEAEHQRGYQAGRHPAHQPEDRKGYPPPGHQPGDQSGNPPRYGAGYPPGYQGEHPSEIPLDHSQRQPTPEDQGRYPGHQPGDQSVYPPGYQGGHLPGTPQRKPTPEDLEDHWLAEYGTEQQIDAKLLTIPFILPGKGKDLKKTEESFRHIRQSLALYVCGLERDLRVKEAPVLTGLRLRAPDRYLNKFVDKNPHILRYLIRALFMCLAYRMKIDETLYSITQKFVNRVEDYELHKEPNNKDLKLCVDAFHYFDKLVEDLTHKHYTIKRIQTRFPRKQQMQALKNSINSKYGHLPRDGKNGSNITSSLYHSGFNGLQNVMRTEVPGLSQNQMPQNNGYPGMGYNQGLNNPMQYQMPNAHQNGYGPGDPEKIHGKNKYNQQGIHHHYVPDYHSPDGSGHTIPKRLLRPMSAPSSNPATGRMSDQMDQDGYGDVPQNGVGLDNQQSQLQRQQLQQLNELQPKQGQAYQRNHPHYQQDDPQASQQ